MSTRLLAVRPLVRRVAPLVLFGCAAAGGCTWNSWAVWRTPAPPPPAESLVLRAGHFEAEAAPAEGSAAAELAGARDLYRRGEYGKAESVFHRIAEDTKNNPQLAEEARYYEAECLRAQGHWPKASDTYARLLADFPYGAYREQAAQQLFEIADRWLDDTRARMRQQNEGKWSWPTVFHFERNKPLLDVEGRALESLEKVRFSDMTGPLADQALFLTASVKFFNEDYGEADFYFGQLVETHPNSRYAPEAIKLALISKQLSTGGSDYDGRKVAEARVLVDRALRSYPELAGKEGEFLNRQLVSITMQQADKDWKIAEFYRRTGHPGSAYFYYEIVRRRYPGTRYFDMATERMHELKAKAEGKEAPAAPAPAAAAAPTGRAPRPFTPPPADFQPVVPGQPLLGDGPGPETAPSPRPLPHEMQR